MPQLTTQARTHEAVTLSSGAVLRLPNLQLPFDNYPARATVLQNNKRIATTLRSKSCGKIAHIQSEMIGWHLYGSHGAADRVNEE
jgi:hypothetical protein